MRASRVAKSIVAVAVLALGAAGCLAQTDGDAEDVDAVELDQTSEGDDPGGDPPAEEDGNVELESIVEPVPDPWKNNSTRELKPSSGHDADGSESEPDH